MKSRKIMSIIMLLAALLAAVSIIVMHSVEASSSSSGEEEVAKNGDDKDNSKDNLENNLFLIGSLMVIITITIVGMYLNLKKEKPVNTEVRVEPVFEPNYQNFDHKAWCDSDSNWSKVNDAEYISDYNGHEYGSYNQQYQSLYSSSEPKY